MERTSADIELELTQLRTHLQSTARELDERLAPIHDAASWTREHQRHLAVALIAGLALLLVAVLRSAHR